MRVVAYTSARDLSRDTAREQRDHIKAWAARHRAHIVAYHEDDEASEGPLYQARPGLMDAIAVLRGDAGVRALVIASRRFLDAHDEAIVEGLARRAGGQVIAVDGSEASPRVEKLIATCDAYARALSSVGTRAKRSEWRAKGAPYGQVPWGYRRSVDGKRLVRDKDEQRVLAVVSHMRASGFKLHEIAAELARAGLRTRRGGPITLARISELLRDIEERPMFEHHRRARPSTRVPPPPAHSPPRRG